MRFSGEAVEARAGSDGGRVGSGSVLVDRRSSAVLSRQLPDLTQCHHSTSSWRWRRPASHHSARACLPG